LYIRDATLSKLLSGVLEVTEQEVEKGLELHHKYVVVDGSCAHPELWTEEMRKNAFTLIEKGGDYDDILAANKSYMLKYFETDSKYRNEYVNGLRSTGVSSIGVTVDHPGFWECMAWWTYIFDHHEDIHVKYTNVDSIKKAKEEGKVVVLWYAQHQADYIGRHLDQWETLQRIGVKLTHIAHNQRNFYGDGGEERTDSGLSNIGIEAVAKLNELGIIIDTSHTGQQTTLESAENSKDGIASIHTACRDLFDHPHNKYDYVLKAIAEGGGVIGVYTNYLSDYLLGRLTDWLDHIDHAVNVMGVDHVGVGTETHITSGEPFEVVKLHDEWYQSSIHGVKPGDEFYGAYIESLDPDSRGKELRFHWADWPNITIGLVHRGYSDREIEKIIGGNWLRLYKEVLDKKKF
jgi:membrane dipeptidase